MKCLKTTVTLSLKAKSNCSLIGFSHELIFVLVAQGAAKLPEVKVGGTKKDPGLEPMPHLNGEDRAEWQDFFQTSNFDTW